MAQRNVTIICGAGVGGGTLVYGGVLAQPAPAPFHQLFPAQIDYCELDRVHYPRAVSHTSAVTTSATGLPRWSTADS
ncbi:hypothetical protein [Streptomyces sp. b94]|uniref:hypothetical protein n=1 Tax=Streptomyces sp. b94 TaxID=1827634 RepID=UPI001FFD464B|nr:hypothetical protein [Streptomyces sp. b94]